MTITFWQLFLAIASGLGTVLALVGLYLLFKGARERYSQARGQLDRALELNRQEDAEIAVCKAAMRCLAEKAIDAEAKSKVEENSKVAMQTIIKKYADLHDENGLPRRAGYGHSYQPGYESVNIMRALGNGAFKDLLIAASGLLLSGIASVLALLFPLGT